MNFNIYLDDLRPLPNIYKEDKNLWVVVRSYKDFVKTIEKEGIPNFISFDHDLGIEEDGTEKTGYDCAKWLVEKNIVLKGFAVHSANPVGAKNIETLLNNFKRFKDIGT